MITVVYRIVTKAGRDKEFREIALRCTECANESNDCLYYSFFRSLENPREFIVYYKFKNKKAQNEHIENLQKKIGPAKKSKKDLPDAFTRLIQDEEIVLFKMK